MSAPALKKIADLPVSSLSEVLSRYSSVVITGGSSGIGKSFIELCAKLNPEVVFCNLSRRAPLINIEELKLRHFPCDLAQSVEISRVISEVEIFLTREVPNGRMLLINNSGFGTYGPFPEPNLSNTLEMIDVNVRAVTQLTGLLYPMLKARGGMIVNVASTAAFVPVTYTAAYAASKAYLLHWSLALNEELRGSRVKTLAFCPGTTATGFFGRAGVKSAAMAGRVSQTSDEVAVAMLRAIGKEQAQAVSGLANKLMIGFCTKLPKPLAARLVARVTARYWQKQVHGWVSDGESTGAASPESADFFAKSGRACAWPRRLRQGPVRMIAPEELRSWIVYEDARLLVVSKPGDVVCHPSKAGPWSSLVGAAREHTQLPTMHLVFRLDRETSGIVVLAKDAKMASCLQTAMMERKVGKKYLAILTGELAEAVTVDQPLGDDTASPVFVKSAVCIGGQPSITHFTPLARGGGFTLARVVTKTGRKHQIRAHAQWLGHRLVGDKIYGPDARCYLEFIDHGWTDALAAKLLLSRQALHCAEIDLRAAGIEHVFAAPLPEDLRAFCRKMGIDVA